MKSRDVKSWTVKWSKLGNDNHVALFSCPFVNTNIIYTKDQIKDILSSDTMSTIPRQVMMNALRSGEALVAAA